MTIAARPPASLATDAHARAEAATRRRLVNAYLREARHDLVVAADGWASVPMPTSGRVLAVEVAHHSVVGLHDYGARMYWDSAGGPLVGFTELLDALLDEVATVAERAGAAPLPDASDRRRALAAQVDASLAATARYLADGGPDLMIGTGVDPTRRAEQSVLLGHPFHPTPKSTEGFGEDLHRYAPELGASFPLHWYAVRPDVLHERRVAQAPWVPDEVASAARRALGSSWAGHALLPVHPWQAQHLAGQPAVQDLVGRGGLVPLGALGPEVYATSSVRTVCDPAYRTAWKLPLHVRITNFVRNNPVSHLARAADASALVATLAPRWRLPGFHVLLETGYRTVDPVLVGEEVAADLAVLFRQHPFADGGASPRVLAGLLEERDGDVPELVREVRLATRAVDPGPAQVATWLRQYLRISLLPLLDVFTTEGVSFEAHVQNSLLNTVDGWPERFWVRDMEGASVSRARLREPEALPADSPLLYDDEEAWLRLRYHVVTNHLGHVVHVLGRHTSAGEAALWGVVRDVLARAGGEHASLLLDAPTLPAKANLVSRFAGRGERPWFVDIPNPLHEKETP
jgi:siderophore synthetase component